MSECETYRKELAAYIYGELSDMDQRDLESHLDGCPECRRELNLIKRVLNGADTLNPDLDRALQEVDWQALPDRLADRILDPRSRPPSGRKAGPRRFWLQPGMRPVYAALALGVVLGVVLGAWIFRSPQPAPLSAGGGWVVPPAALESMDIEIARRSTLDYLDRSQYLLLDLVQASPEGASVFWNSDLASRQAKELLSKKKYIDQHLDSFHMLKAKAICDQIELLFLELTQISRRLTAAEMAELQNLVQERRLMLKIKLVKKELQESEV
jgi:hypothetical protein